MQDEEQKKKIKRTRGFLFGVCGGLAEHYDFDALPLRLLFLLLTYAGLPMVLIYFALMLFFMEAPDVDSDG